MPRDERPVELVEALEDTMRRLHAAGFSFAPFTIEKKPNYRVLPKVWDPREARDKPSWEPYQTRQPSVEELEDWVADPGTTAILLICGYGGVFAFDFDHDPKPAAEQVRTRFMAQLQDNGMWPEPGEYDIYAEDTPGLGLHLIACVAEDVEVPPKHKLAFRAALPGEEGQWKPTIEFQGRGSGVIIAPSWSYKGEYLALGTDIDKLIAFDQATLDVWLGVAASFDERPAPVAVPVDHVDRKPLLDDDSVIAAWRSVHPLREQLERNSYKPVTPYTYRRAAGTHGSVVILDGRDGVERAYHHNTTDPMNGKGRNGGCDAFDYFVEFDHHGDFKAAVRAASEELGMNKKPKVPSVPTAQTITPATVVQPTLDAAPPDDRTPWSRHLFTSADTSKIKPPTYILGDVFMEDSIAFVVGPSSVGKTFWILDQVCRLMPDDKVALIVAGEGKAGLMQRINTWEAYYNKPAPHVFFLTYPVKLMDPDEVSSFIAHFSELRPDVIVFDTLHVMMSGGDENSPKDSGQAIDALNRIRAAWGACVIAVHHVNKEGKYRGHSSFYNDADTFLTFENDDGCTQVITTKQRNAAEPPPFWYELAHFGESRVALPIDPFTWAPPDMTPLQRRILYALSMSYFNGSAKSNELLTQLDDATPSAVRKATSRLIDKGYCTREKDVVSITQMGREALKTVVSGEPLEADDPDGPPALTYQEAQAHGIIHRPRPIGR